MAESNCDEHDTSKVEIATLVLPSEAVGVGLQPGDGTDVVLEAAPETLERLVVEQQPSSNGQQQQYNSTSAVVGTEAHSRIEAVIDLNAVCEQISGMMPDELVEILHRDHAAAMEEYEQEISPHEEMKEDIDLEVNEEKRTDEHTPFLHDAREETELIEGAALQLSADPFVETLSNLLPSIPLDPEITKVETTLDAEDNHLAHDAFLIRAVAHDQGGMEESKEDGGIEDTFILALPQVRGHEDSHPTGGSSLGRMVIPLVERAMSELPTDVQHVELHAKTVQVPTDTTETHGKYHEGDLVSKEMHEEIQLDLVVERRVPVIGVVILVIGLFSLASVGVALELQGGGVGPLTKTYWRNQATAICLFPFAVKKLNMKELSKLSKEEWLIYYPLSACCYAFLTAGFVTGLEMTSLANAFILSNLASIIIIVTKLILGMPVLLLEGVGAIIGLSGSLVCTLTPVASETDDNDQQPGRFLVEKVGRAHLGDAICFAASFATAGYLVIAGKLRKKLDLFVYMFLLFSLSSILITFYAAFFSDERVTFSRHPVHGVFGWTNLQPDRLPLELYTAIICNIVGSTGYIAVLKYFDPVVVSVVMLLEPAVAAFQGYAAGVSPLPGLQTWIGDAVVVLGSVIVIMSGMKKTEHVDINFSDVATEPKMPMELQSPSLNSNIQKSPLKPSNVLQQRRKDVEDDFTDNGNTKQRRGLSDDMGGKRVVFE